MSIPEFLLDADKLEETDKAIMEIVKEFCEKLGRTGHNPREIRWEDEDDTAFPPDWPIFLLGGKLGLRVELKGKLTPAEWRPLLASSTVFETRFRGRERLLRAYVLSSIAISIFPTILFFLFLCSFPFPSSIGYARGAASLTFGFFIAVALLLLGLPAPYFRRLRLRSDQIAPEEFGTREDLATVLKKIDDMSITPAGRIIRLGTLFPTISRRLRNLAQ
jgi:hypothetical protein